MNNIIITTHSKRLRQLFNKYFNNFNKKIHFMNCCIIKLSSNNSDNNYKVIPHMIYEGELDTYENRNMNKYYNTHTFNSGNIYSNILQIPSNVNIYLIRHAQGYHNLNSGIARYIKIANYNIILKDPQLTEIGISQSLKCGNELKKYINNLDKNYFFCSKFRRTRETLSYIMGVLNINQEILILQYSHEIKTLDANDLKDYINEKNIKKDKIINNIKVNWTYFNENLQNFNYDYNSNMIYEAYFIIGKINDRDIEKIDRIKNTLFEL